MVSEDGLALQEAGAVAIVLEAVTPGAAAMATDRINTDSRHWLRCYSERPNRTPVRTGGLSWQLLRQSEVSVWFHTRSLTFPAAGTASR